MVYPTYGFATDPVERYSHVKALADDPGVRLNAAPYLGPILMDNKSPVQWIYEQRLLPEPVRNLLFSGVEA